MDPTAKIDNFWERLTFGGSMLLIGIAVVFAVLIIIWASLAVFKIYFANGEKKAPVEEAPVTPVEQAAVPQDTEIVAVIAAAIAAAESESNGIKFKVVSFRRK